MKFVTAKIDTEHLHLRPCALADVDALHQLWTDAAVRKYLWDDVIIDKAQTMEIINSSRADFQTHGFGHWVVTRKGQAALIGWCGLRYFGEPPEVEVLYGLLPQFWGQGWATEATNAVLQFGFTALGLQKIYAGTDPPNTASIRVMERVGMKFDKHIQINGLPAIYYVLSRED